MDRRQFLKDITATTAGITCFPSESRASKRRIETNATNTTIAPESAADTEGYTLLCEFTLDSAVWKVYEDLRTRDGSIALVSPSGKIRMMAKSAEAAFAGADPPHLGLSLNDIGLSDADLLADRLLAGGGDPDPEKVKSAAPPQGSAAGGGPSGGAPRARWDAFVGTSECYDTQPVYPGGNTRTYHPSQYFPELRSPAAVQKRFDGLLGGWMPAVRKVMPLSENSYIEAIVFGDVEARDRFIVQTWHRTALIEGGRMTKVVYGHSYPAFPPARLDPKPEEFYRALLVFAHYWDRQLKDVAAASLPDNSWVDMSRHYFAKELMVRPGGIYPKYGAVDRDYYGSEYDGFQDIFTSAVSVNLEWGRFETARRFIDNYFTDFVDAKGVNNMRGPETAQFGLTLSLLSRYLNYTGDGALLLKHKSKIQATARLLTDLHDASLKLPADDPGYGLIHGWSESDACLAATPEVWWKPYYANSAFAARGLRDIGKAWPALKRLKPAPEIEKEARDWQEHARVLQDATLSSMEKNIRRDKTPPYVPPLPGTGLMFREALAKERPSPQQWPHRAYAELLHADILPEKLAHLVIDTMRAYGGTTLGVVANVGPARPGGRAILGFISYGYAQMLLRLDRIEEYLLFLYSHRCHAHTRGSWVAGEVSGINGSTALFCIPAQQTIPIMVRWMLVLEDSDEDRLYFAKGVPRDWVSSGQPIRIGQAPTRWGRVDFEMQAQPASKSIIARIGLARPGAPAEIRVKLRVPPQTPIQAVTVNGRTASLGGVHNDTVNIKTGNQKQFEVVGRLS
jgi:hypothetical protein